MDDRNLREPDSNPASAGADRGVVELPHSLVERVEARLDRSEFETVDEYVTYVLEEVLGRVEDASDDSRSETVDRAEVENRLKSLGYLD